MPIAFIIFCCQGILRAQSTTSFNFTAAPVSVSGWVNVSGDPAQGVRTATDPATGISISSVSTLNWGTLNGGCAFNGGGSTATPSFFPTAVMVNHWFQYSSVYTGYNGAIPQLQISHLNPDSVYTLKMTGSFPPGGSNELNPIRYTVAGAIVNGYIDINGDNNHADGAVFNNIAPDPSGNIKVYVNTFGSSTVASICGLQIIRQRSVAPTPIIQFTHPTNGQVLPEDGNVIVDITASETNGSIAKIYFYVGDSLMNTDSVAPYEWTWTNPDAGTYTLKARAIDGLGNSNLTSINISIESLSSYWSMTGNIAANADINFLGTVDTNRLAFRTHNIERVSILGDGTVGIGTRDTKGYALAVNGNAIFSKIRVRAYADWPDYVFEKGYRLPGLDSLDKYILLHRHLPGLASEGEVKEEGLDMADNQALLLKKIEELTLYLIWEHKDRIKEHEDHIKEHERVEKLIKEVQRLRRQNASPLKK